METRLHEVEQELARTGKSAAEHEALQSKLLEQLSKQTAQLQAESAAKADVERQVAVAE